MSPKRQNHVFGRRAFRTASVPGGERSGRPAGQLQDVARVINLILAFCGQNGSQCHFFFKKHALSHQKPPTLHFQPIWDLFDDFHFFRFLAKIQRQVYERPCFFLCNYNGIFQKFHFLENRKKMKIAKKSPNGPKMQGWGFLMAGRKYLEEKK